MYIHQRRSVPHFYKVTSDDDPLLINKKQYIHIDIFSSHTSNLNSTHLSQIVVSKLGSWTARCSLRVYQGFLNRNICDDQGQSSWRRACLPSFIMLGVSCNMPSFHVAPQMNGVCSWTCPRIFCKEPRFSPRFHQQENQFRRKGYLKEVWKPLFYIHPS